MARWAEFDGLAPSRMDERGKHPTPGGDRVRDGRHLLAQADDDGPSVLALKFKEPTWYLTIARQLHSIGALGRSEARVLTRTEQKTGDQVV